MDELSDRRYELSVDRARYSRTLELRASIKRSSSPTSEREAVETLMKIEVVRVRLTVLVLFSFAVANRDS
jgi:hypothetical protein